MSAVVGNISDYSPLQAGHHRTLGYADEFSLAV
jgi:hypothetical protein